MRTSITGIAVGALMLSTAAGCNLDHEFVIREVVSVDSSGAATVQPVDLAAIAGDAWSERNKIKDVDVKSATATLTAVGAGNTAPTGSGTASLRRAAAPADEVLFAQATGIPIEIGQGYAATNLGALAGVVKRSLDGDGKLEILASGAADSGVAQFDAEIVIRVKVTFGMF
jgi:hypothetical protein